MVGSERPAAWRVTMRVFLPTTWRGRWRSLLVLAIIIGVSSGVVFAAVAGARRSATSLSRFHAAAYSPDLFIGEEVGGDPAPLRRLLGGPLVDDHLDLVFVFAGVNLSLGTVFFAPTDPQPSEIDRGVLLEGRRADTGDPDEIVLSETVARQLELGPGDTLELRTLSPAQATALFEEDYFPTSVDELEGPILRLLVAGVARTGSDLGARTEEPGLVRFTPAFLERYGGEVGVGPANHMVRLAEHPDAAGRFSDAVDEAYAGSSRPSINAGLGGAVVTDSIAVITAALVLGGLVIAGAGVVWIVSAVARHQRLAAADVDVLGVMGATPAERRMLLAGTVAPGLVAGLLFAPVVAVALSPLLPVGLARRVDPDPGLHADLGVMVVGTIALLAIAGAAAWFTALRIVAAIAGRQPGGLQSPWVVDRAARWLRPAPGTGVRFAFFAPRTNSAPVRPALAGAMVGVVGLAAVAVVGTSLDRLVASPARWGTTWDVAVEAENLDRESVLDNPDIAAAAVGRFDDQVTLNGRSTTAMALEPLKGDIAPTVIDGRAPRADDEVAIGRDTLADLDITVGETVEIAGRRSGRERFRVVGVAAFPSIDLSFPLADGAAFTGRGAERLRLFDELVSDDVGFEALVIRWAPGVDHGAALQRLGEGTEASQPVAPPEVNGLDDVRALPIAVAGALAALGVIVTSHALLLTVRRRRLELGVLSALGFAPGHRRTVIAAQATSIACAALIIGLPIGVIVGRMAWSAITQSMGVATDPTLPLPLLAVGAAALIVAFNMIAVVPARMARRLCVADTLRSE